MILSMTGFGKAETLFNGKKIHVEIKSLNSKTLDLNTRIAALYREHELEIRALIAEKLLRGKVDFTITTEAAHEAAATPINGNAVKSYVAQIRGISENSGIDAPADWWPVLLRFPDVTTPAEQEKLCDEEWNAVKQAIHEAIDMLLQFREQEGRALQDKFSEKINNIGRLLEEVEPYEKSRVEKIKARIIDGLAEIKDVEINDNRLEQEMIYYIEKLDVSEEKQRLANHLKYFRETMDGPFGQGKKLGFISQEIGREVNTLGSKSNLAEMQNIVVKMKDELEQIKEQVLNAL